jgi:hypothetical protein
VSTALIMAAMAANTATLEIWVRAPGGGGRSPHVRLASGSAQGGQAGQR